MAHDPNAPRPEWPPRIIRDFPPYDNQGNWPGGTDVVRDIQMPVAMPPAGGGGPQQAPQVPQMSPTDEAQQLQRAYRQFLGRAASPQEIQGWLSGAYGHGQSGNLMPIFEAIRTSPEAQQRPPVNRPMPVPGGRSPMEGGPSIPGAKSMGPSLNQWADQARQYRAQGEAAGNDMSWMDQPGALAGPRGFVGSMGQLPQRPQRPSAKPLGGQEVQRMRRAILGVPEY